MQLDAGRTTQNGMQNPNSFKRPRNGGMVCARQQKRASIISDSGSVMTRQWLCQVVVHLVNQTGNELGVSWTTLDWFFDVR